MLDLKSNPAYRLRPGDVPILISIPHNGSLIPKYIADGMTTAGKSSRDTDWFLDRLYDVPESKSFGFLVAEYSRYIIDLNRSANDESLYPGQTTSSLVPTLCFDGSPIYHGTGPEKAEIKERITRIWRPYHHAIQTELERLCGQHSIAVLIEAHSIRSEVPRLFDGVLPDFNIGTNVGKSCDPGLTRAVTKVLDGQDRYSHVVDGRFVGGHITRHFGRPANGIHALQIELSQATYLNEVESSWDPSNSGRVQMVIRQVLAEIGKWVQQQ
jgi:N-formylglutamate deformylase